MWSIVEELCRIETNKTCGTHIHVSPANGHEWQLEHVKSMARSILHFEPAFEVLVSAHRRGNEYTKSNSIDNPSFEHKTVAQCFDQIDQCTHVTDVADLMNANGDRYYGWNFLNLYYGGKGTIEFRRGPGIRHGDDTLAWAELTVSLAQGAKIHGTASNLARFSMDVAGLQSFVLQEVVQGMNMPELLLPLFAGKSGPLQPMKVGNLSPVKKEKLEKKKEQDDKKNLIMKKIMRS
jgi:hypothetical protein